MSFEKVARNGQPAKWFQIPFQPFQAKNDSLNIFFYRSFSLERYFWKYRSNTVPEAKIPFQIASTVPVPFQPEGLLHNAFWNFGTVGTVGTVFLPYLLVGPFLQLLEALDEF
jgi:hypothetical protein